MPYFGVVVPRSESAVGHGPYPRALVTPRVCASRREGLRAIEINAITWRDALLDHETRFEAYILDDDEIVWSRSFGRDEKDDAEPFTKAELRKLKAEHEASHDVPVVRRPVVTLTAAPAGPFGGAVLYTTVPPVDAVEDVRAALNGHNPKTK